MATIAAIDGYALGSTILENLLLAKKCYHAKQLLAGRAILRFDGDEVYMTAGIIEQITEKDSVKINLLGAAQCKFEGLVLKADSILIVNDKTTLLGNALFIRNKGADKEERYEGREIEFDFETEEVTVDGVKQIKS